MKRHQKGVLGVMLLFLTVVLLAVAAAEAEAIQVDIYRNYQTCTNNNTCLGGAPYSNYVGSIFSSDVLFATSTGYNWHPFNLISFGALIQGYLSVASAGSFQFTLNSDDGSMLYIDGKLIVNNGIDNGHPPRTVSSSASLSPGLHPFRIEFFEDFRGESGVDLYLPPGVTYVPEPLTLILLGLGLLGIAGFRRRAK